MKKLPTIALLILVLTGAPAFAEEWGPWEITAARQEQAESFAPLQWAVTFFQRYISPIDGPRCSMYPTCSAYALKALQKHGPLLGVFQTVDRLYREGDTAHEHDNPIEKWGYIRYYDPLADNDFWLE